MSTNSDQKGGGTGIGGIVFAVLTGASVVAATYLAVKKAEKRLSGSAEAILARCGDAMTKLEDRVATAAA